MVKHNLGVKKMYELESHKLDENKTNLKILIITNYFKTTHYL